MTYNFYLKKEQNLKLSVMTVDEGNYVELKKVCPKLRFLILNLKT